MDKDPPHDRFLISFNDGYHLALDDRRMFGKGDLVEDPDEFIRERKLGPHPLALDTTSFRERFDVSALPPARGRSMPAGERRDPEDQRRRVAA